MNSSHSMIRDLIARALEDKRRRKVGLPTQNDYDSFLDYLVESTDGTSRGFAFIVIHTEHPDIAVQMFNS